MKFLLSLSQRLAPLVLLAQLGCAPEGPTLERSAAALSSEGLIGAWALAGNLSDASGNGNHAIHINGFNETAPAVPPAWSPDSGALSLNGVDTSLRIPSSPSLNTTGETMAVTISAWVKARSFAPSTDEANAIAVRHEAGTSYEHFGLFLFGGRPTGGVHFSYTMAPNPIPLGSWVHLAMTYDGVQMTTYQNGAPVVSMSIGFPINPDNTAFTIGAGQNGEILSEFFDGEIRDVRLYSRALSASEIRALAQ